MHTLLGLSSMLLVMLSSYVVLYMLRRSPREGIRSPWRRNAQLLVLAAPVLSLGLGTGGLYHFAGRTCFISAPSWDYVLGIALPLVIGLGAIGGLILGLVRLFLMYRVVTRNSALADVQLQELARHLAYNIGAPSAHVRVCAYNRPLALTYGFLRPTVLVSTWMIEHLDRRELESVLAHELAHVARRDYLVIWAATVLRDAFFYLPTSWLAYRQLQQEKESACDDLAVGVTKRPLALASALAKVWQQSVAEFGTSPVVAQHLTGGNEAIEDRITRLLAVPEPALAPAGTWSRSQLEALGVGASGLGSMLALQAATVTVMLALMGCGPIALLGRLL